MSNDFELDAEFSTIMAATRSRPAPYRPTNTVPPNTSSAGNNHFVPQPGDGRGPSRVYPRNERASPQPSIQMKYDTIVKGFKVLEASYEESQRKLTIAEERLSVIDAAHAALIAEMETAKQILHDREMEINALREDVETNKTTLHNREAEIETVRGELQENKVALAGYQEKIKAINQAVEDILECGICYISAVQPISTDCRHTFCASCLFGWWTTSRETTCPTCRTICENAPARDRSDGLISLISGGGSNESVEKIDTDRFVELMEENRLRAEVKRAGEAMVVDYTILGQGGTSDNPLDLTRVWNS